MSPSPAITHALSFDIEDWFHIAEIDAVKDPATWPSLPSLVVERTAFILRILDEHQTKATFFILGWVAERYPGIVRDIDAAGHEIASHGYWHQLVYTQTPEVFRDDLRRSREVIGAHTKQAIAGYRAPSFSITPGTEWAFDEILGAGFTYDASLFPAARGQGGYPCPQGAHLIERPGGGTLRELPMSVASVGVGPLRKRMCYCGGGYMRLLPLWLIEQGMAAESRAGRPTVVYLHPRDFAPDCPRVPMPLARKFRTYVGLRTTERKLRALLARHRWGTCAQVLGATAAHPSGRADTV